MAHPVYGQFLVFTIISLFSIVSFFIQEPSNPLLLIFAGLSFAAGLFCLFVEPQPKKNDKIDALITAIATFLGNNPVIVSLASIVAFFVVEPSNPSYLIFAAVSFAFGLLCKRKVI